MSQIIGYLHFREVESQRYPIYENIINFPSGILEHQTKTGEPIILVLSKEMNYEKYEEERKNPLFPEYIYIHIKNINNENGKRII